MKFLLGLLFCAHIVVSSLGAVSLVGKVEFVNDNHFIVLDIESTSDFGAIFSLDYSESAELSFAEVFKHGVSVYALIDEFIYRFDVPKDIFVTQDKWYLAIEKFDEAMVLQLQDSQNNSVFVDGMPIEHLWLAINNANH